MQQIEELVRQGVSRAEISRLAGIDPKTIRKYLRGDATAPRYGPRPPRPSKLDRFKPYIEQRLRAGVWNAVVLLGELRRRGYSGGYTILKDYLQPLREAGRTVAVRRFETPAGRQAQLDWGYLGEIEDNGRKRKLWAFVFTLGHSRAMMAAAAVDQKLPTLLRLYEEAFRQLGGVPREILYDRMKTVVEGTDERGETRWNRVFADFARYWGFTPRASKPYRAQTKDQASYCTSFVTFDASCG